MNRSKRPRFSLVDLCFIAVWALVLATSCSYAAGNDMPEVLRYAQEYTQQNRNKTSRSELHAEVSQARKLARSELIRRQQQTRIAVLEKELKARKAESRTDSEVQENVARLTRELNISGETVRKLTQKLSQAQQKMAELQIGATQNDGKMKTVLKEAQSEIQLLNGRVTTLEQEKKKLQEQQVSTKASLQQTQASLKKQTEESSRLEGELNSVRNNAAELEKQKSELEKTMTAMKADSARISLKTPSERQAYALGVMYARDVQEALDGNRMLGITFDSAALKAGLNDALAESQPLRLDKDTLAAVTESLEKKASDAFRTVTARQKKLADDWLKKFRKEKGTEKDAVGFWYRVTYVGDGNYLKQDDTVDVVVEERLVDGTVISDMDRTGSSLRQKVEDFPPVFAAGLLRLKNHGQITLAVPPELAYGDKGYPPDVPPGAMMIYNIRVSDVIPAIAGG